MHGETQGKGRNDMRHDMKKEENFAEMESFYTERRLEKNKWKHGENFSYTKREYFVSEENEKTKCRDVLPEKEREH